MSSGGAPMMSSPGERVITGAAAVPSSTGHSSGVASSSSAGGNAACAACKYQRRKCATDCPLAPYFPPDQPKRFLNVHRLFGVSSILRILRQVDLDKREDTVKSIVYEADTREKDPVHGCLGIIHLLQNQVNKLRDDLALARDQLYHLEQQHTSSILQQTYGHPHAGSQANYHYHHLQPQQYASTSQHQGASFHDAVPGQLMAYQDSRAYHDHARYLVSDQESALQDMLGHHIKVESASDPYIRSSMGGLRYVSDSGGHHMQNLGVSSQQHQGGSSSTYHALGGDLERRSNFYNPLINDHVTGRHVDPLRSVAPLQVLDPLTNHSPHVTVASDPELRNAGVHLSLTNQYSM